jgi:hypothetical protein
MGGLILHNDAVSLNPVAETHEPGRLARGSLLSSQGYILPRGNTRIRSPFSPQR